MATDTSPQHAHAGQDAYVAGGDIKTINIYGRGEDDFRPPFLVVDADFLAQERKKPKAPYIARPPLWADVVHGQDPDSRFLEREQFGALVAAIDGDLLQPLRRGSDLRLHTLFVTGAPGCGKSTLVRHAAATLVERGAAVVADLGVNHGRLIADDLESYLKGLTQLAAGGKPVLLLMDDPFFANSDWELLLETLGRPNYAGIAVLGATPTYLFETYGRPLAGHQVVLKTFPLGATTSGERQSLAEMYGVRNDPDIDRAIGRHEDLLVFAMETASGSSFNEIIERIWKTLNDGRAIGPKTAIADVEWPVLAFLLTSYLHRHYVTCPESLLRSFLVDLAGNATTDFVYELSELTLGEGWHIFRVSPPDSASQAMIGTMHARVAARAWEVRPFKALDQAGLLARASARAPECAPQLAEFILACQPQRDPADRGLPQRVSEQWRDESISTAQLAALVHGLSPRPAANPFRPALRARLKRRDSQSWLAAAALIPLERPGSDERNRLNQTELPFVLTLADLSADSSEAIRLLGRRAAPGRQSFGTTLSASLRGELDWELDDKLLIWLLENRPVEDVRPLLPYVHDWLDSHQDDERARAALIGWYAAHASRLTPAEIEELVDRIREWIGMLPSTQSVLSAFSVLASALLDADSPGSVSLLTDMSSWLDLWPDDSYLRERLLRLLAQHYQKAPATAANAVTETLDWLAVHPAAGEVRRALLGLILADPAHPRAAAAVTELLSWIGEGPTDAQFRDAWVKLFQALPPSTVAQLLPGELGWLGAHQDEPGGGLARSVLVQALAGYPDAEPVLSAVRDWLAAHPDDSVVRAGFLGVVRKLPDPAFLAEIIADARGWVLSHPGDVTVRGPFLSLVHARPGHLDSDEVIELTMAWLAGRPDDEEGRLTLLQLARGEPGRSQAAEVVAAMVDWLDPSRGGNEIWVELFGLVRDAPEHPYAPAVCAAARRWLAGHPEDSHVRTGLIRFIRTLPDRPQADEVIQESLAWLEVNPGDINVRVGLSRLVRDVAGSSAVRDQIAQARAWAEEQPDSAGAREWVMSLARDLGDADVMTEVINESRGWLAAHWDNPQAWASLLGLARAAPDYPDATGVIADARQWLAGHRDDSHVRTGLLAYIKDLPGRPEAAELVAETGQWLARYGENQNVSSALASLQRVLDTGLPRYRPSAGTGIDEAWTYLAEYPDDRTVRVRLLALVRAAAGHPLGPEIIAGTRRWLDEHPDDGHVRHAFLLLVRARPDMAELPAIIAQTRRWLDEHPDDSHVRYGFLVLAGTLRDDPGIFEIITQTRRWLDEHPGDTHVRPVFTHLLASVPGYPGTADFVSDTLAWLDKHPEQVFTRIRVLGLIQHHPGHPHAVAAVKQAHEWLAGDPADKRPGAALLDLVAALPENLSAAGEVQQARQWVSEHPVTPATPAARLTTLRRVLAGHEFASPQVLGRAREWLDEYPDDADARTRVLNLTAQVPGHPGAAAVVADGRRWIAGHPDQTVVRAALFHLSLLLPDDPEAAEVVMETFRWLCGAPDDPQLRMGHFFLALQEVPGHPRLPEVVEAARRWLADSPEAARYRPGLLRVLCALPQSAVAADVVLETRLWLLEHEDDTPARVSMLNLLAMMPGYPEAAEVVRETRLWLAENPDQDSESVRAAVLTLARTLPDDPDAIQ